MNRLSKLTEDQLQEYALEAIDGFWAVIVKRFPNAPGGDFSPEGTFAFEAACKDAIDEWVHWNAEPDDSED